MNTTAGPVMLAVSVVFAREDSYWSIPLSLPAGSRVGDALAALRGDARHEQAKAEIAGLAIFGRLVNEESPLHAGDRVELLRALVADPKQARRERAGVPKRRP
jgi:uncharacterized protein